MTLLHSVNPNKIKTIRDEHCGLKIPSSQAKTDENFANYSLKTKANNKSEKQNFLIFKFSMGVIFKKSV